MSILSVPQIINRIQSASERSPIAVFKATPDTGMLNAVFGATVMTQQNIKRGGWGHCDYIGSFHNGMDMEEVREKLQRSL